MVPLCLSLGSSHPNLVWMHRILWSNPSVIFIRANHCKSWPLESTTSSLTGCPCWVGLDRWKKNHDWGSMTWSSPGVCSTVGLVRWPNVLLPLFPEPGISLSMMSMSSLLDVLLFSTWSSASEMVASWTGLFDGPAAMEVSAHETVAGYTFECLRSISPDGNHFPSFGLCCMAGNSCPVCPLTWQKGSHEKTDCDHSLPSCSCWRFPFLYSLCYVW